MIKSANEVAPPPPFRPPAGVTPNQLEAAPPAPGGASWMESLEMARAAVEQQIERMRVIENDRETIVARAFHNHVEGLQQGQLPAPYVGAGVGALGCAVWSGSKWDGQEPADLLRKVLLGAGLGAVGGALAGALYQRMAAPPLPRVSPVIPPLVETMLWIDLLPNPLDPDAKGEKVPAWRMAAWKTSWAELAQRYTDYGTSLRAWGPPPMALSFNPAALLPSGVRAVLR
jgi:hypothetical protein